jgi:hypothetical protein
MKTLVVSVVALFLTLLINVQSHAYWDVGGSSLSPTSRYPNGVADGEGGVAIVWLDEGATPGIFLRKVNREGETVWTTPPLASESDEVAPQVVKITGGYIVAGRITQLATIECALSGWRNSGESASFGDASRRGELGDGAIR